MLLSLLYMAAKQKFYVVWQGRRPGVYDSWDECKAQTEGSVGAMYKSFNSKDEAMRAFEDGMPQDYYKRKGEPKQKLQNPPSNRHDTVLPLPLEVKAEAWAVDAACSGNPGKMEYRAVDLTTGEEVFHFGPMRGTNNIGEFLAIVHAAALLTQKQKQLTIYSDSRNAILWYRAKQCRTRLPLNEKNRPALDLVKRAESWLQTHTCNLDVIKWNTGKWGEIPADFGRK